MTVLRSNRILGVLGLLIVADVGVRLATFASIPSSVHAQAQSRLQVEGAGRNSSPVMIDIDNTVSKRLNVDVNNGTDFALRVDVAGGRSPLQIEGSASTVARPLKVEIVNAALAVLGGLPTNSKSSPDPVGIAIDTAGIYVVKGNDVYVLNKTNLALLQKTTLP